MKPVNWSPEKNREIVVNRGISFEDIVFCVRSGGLLDDMAHPNTAKCSHQRVLVVAGKGYEYLVSYVESDHEISLLTVIPSRKATKQYLGDNK